MKNLHLVPPGGGLFKVKTLTDLNNFFAGKKILVTEGEWKNEECEFIRMEGKAEILKNQKPSQIKMIVKTRFGNEIELQQDQVFVIEKKVTINPANN